MNGRARRSAWLQASVPHGVSSPEYAAVDRDLHALKHRLELFHAGSPDLVLTGGRRAWRVAAEAMPESTTLVTAATGYSYGQQTRGTGHNPYPLTRATRTRASNSSSPTPGRLTAGLCLRSWRATSTRRGGLAGVALRGLAAGYEIAAMPFGWDLGVLREWEASVDELIVETDGGVR